MKEVLHPLLTGMEEREYQTKIAETSGKRNTLVCLPTGLGKTNIAIIVAASRLKQFPETQILVVAPTKPLVSQHANSFKKFLTLDPGQFQVITGSLPPGKRTSLYHKQIIFATPQTIQKDLEHERFSLRGFSLLVIDELHHAVGKYAYPYIAKRFLKESSHPRILGLTASPGSSRQKIQEICRNTGIEAVEVRTEKDEDVLPYVKEKTTEWIEVSLPASFVKIQSLFEDAFTKRMKKLKTVRTKKGLLALQRNLQQSIQKGNKAAYGLSSLVAQAIKIDYALTLLETQGISILRTYLRGLREDPSKAAQSLLKDRAFSNGIFLTESLFEQGSRHPKMSTLCSLVENQLREHPESKIIIFANFRETVKELHSILKKIDSAWPLMLVGQKDLSQKQQLEIIRQYEEEANCLITTSIGEEGLSLESADLAVFYEPVPSEIRQIQRRGRVGRTKVGKIAVLVTKKTRDEAYKWAAYHKERKMMRTLSDMHMKQSRFI